MLIAGSSNTTLKPAWAEAAEVASATPVSDPAVSVVMPSMNQAAFLGAAVRSVMEQADAPPLELVVMDGGSEDGSQTLLAKLSAEFPGRIRWASGPDGGPASAINEGVRRARAPVIGWLNSDDLYAPGAIARAAAYLAAHPQHVMVYGHGEHVDALAEPLGAYPTRRPSISLGDWADGCHICQPTAFFRRQAFLDLGGLDTGLRASFDYDLWLRFFKAWPGSVGFIDALQARSRLHEAAITTRLRERIAFEGLEIVSRHLGPAPAHWLLTHFEELCAQHPFLPGGLQLARRCELLIERARPFIDADGLLALHQRLISDARLLLATESVHVGVHADGWAGPLMEVRVLQGEQPLRALQLHCRQRGPGDGGRLQVRLDGPDGAVDSWTVDGNGPFVLDVALPDQRPGARLVLRMHTRGGFVPALCEAGSTDGRELAFRVEQLVLTR
jgi:hypothetical protein